MTSKFRAGAMCFAVWVALYGGSVVAADQAAAQRAGVFDVNGLGPKELACRDFDAFVNQDWKAHTNLAADENAVGSFQEINNRVTEQLHDLVEDAARNESTLPKGSLTQKLGRLYAAGMDEAAIEAAGLTPVRPWLNRINALRSGRDIPALLASFGAEGFELMYSVNVLPAQNDATKNVIVVAPYGTGLPSPEYYVGPKYSDIRSAYLAYVERVLRLTGVSAIQAKAQAKDVLAIETTLAARLPSRTEMRDFSVYYNMVTTDQAHKITPHISWDDHLKAFGVPDDDQFSLAMPGFFSALDERLAHASIAQWKAYLTFHLVDSAASLLSKDVRNASFDFNGRAIKGELEEQARWKQVIGSMKTDMGMAMSEVYVDHYVKAETKVRAAAMVEHIRDAFAKRIASSTWMTEATRKKALDKLGRIQVAVAYPDAGQWRDWSAVDIVPGAWFTDLITLEVANKHWMIAQLSRPVDRTQWGNDQAFPHEVNAAYDPTKNSIAIYAAILQPPLFYPEGDDATNYGALGAIIGHEFTHGFDDVGGKYDAAGNRANWWADADLQRFTALGQRLTDQFDAYHPYPSLPSARVNGKLTLGENIADLGGLNIAYDALQASLGEDPAKATPIDGYTPAQRFFMSWARAWRMKITDKEAAYLIEVDPHSPSGIRTYAAASNMGVFADAFQCKAGSPMVRAEDKRIRIW